MQKILYSLNPSRKVRTGKHLSRAISAQNGLKQEDTLSPLLFKLAVEYAIRKAQENIGIEWYISDCSLS
jgi:hypothetical protein